MAVGGRSPLDHYEANALYNCYAGHGGVEIGSVAVVQSPAECAQICDSDGDCVGFVFMYSQGKCWKRAAIYLPQCEVGEWGKESSEFVTFAKKHQGQLQPPQPQVPQQPQQDVRRRRRWGQGSCRRRSSGTGFLGGLPDEDVGTGWSCRGSEMAYEEPTPGLWGTCDACLCVFDIDRTLTGKQSATAQCPENTVEWGLWDEAYGGGHATLSKLSTTGIQGTFCNQCYLGITSAGDGSGEDSPWNKYLLEHVMQGHVHDSFKSQHPDSARWSHGMDVVSPYVLGQDNKRKQDAVEKVRQWYGEAPRGICIKPDNVYFFGDRTENIKPFALKGLNSREISCGSRDWDQGGSIGLCGATPDEIQRVPGNILCTQR